METPIIDGIVASIDWNNYQRGEDELEEARAAGDSEQDAYWSIPEVLHCKLEYVREQLKGEDNEEFRNAIEHVQAILGLLDDATLYDLEKRCKACGERMYTTVRAHHHTENGVDATS